MRLVLLTNMPSYHQMELGAVLADRLGEENFRLVFHHGTSDERAEMGWSDHYAEPWVLRFDGSEQQRAETVRWIRDAEVVVQGRFPMKYVRARIWRGDLVFAYQERFWKRRFSRLKVLLRLPRILRRYWTVNRRNYHLLSAGAYVANDLHRLGCFRGRSWKFGYFINALDPAGREVGEQPTQLLWCARFSPVKQPQHALRLLQALTRAGVDCQLTMVGDGQLRDEAVALSEQMQLQQRVDFTGWQSAQQVSQYMLSADFFLMTSRAGEGWALVVNEALRAGCAVIANQAVGSAPWLVRDGENGFVYRDDIDDSLVARLAGLTRAEVVAMGGAAVRQHRKWSAQVAGERLIRLGETLLTDDEAAAQQLFADGPCSPDQGIRDVGE